MCFVAAITGVILYIFIVQPRNHNNNENENNNSRGSLSKSSSSSSSSSIRASSSTLYESSPSIIPYQQYLLVYGVLLPFWIVFPSMIVKQFYISNLVFRFAIGAIIPTLSLFRILETLYGFTPTYFKCNGCLQFVLYFACPMVIRLEEEQVAVATEKEETKEESVSATAVKIKNKNN